MMVIVYQLSNAEDDAIGLSSTDWIGAAPVSC